MTFCRQVMKVGCARTYRYPVAMYLDTGTFLPRRLSRVFAVSWESTSTLPVNIDRNGSVSLYSRKKKQCTVSKFVFKVKEIEH